MPTRCRNFEADGTPIGRGCPQGDSCRFVHPGDPRWKFSFKYDHGSSRGSRGGGRGRGRGISSSTSWGPSTSPLSAKTPDVTWDPSSWGSAVHQPTIKDAWVASTTSSSKQLSVTTNDAWATTSSPWDDITTQPAKSDHKASEPAWKSEDSGWGGGDTGWGGGDMDWGGSNIGWGSSNSINEWSTNEGSAWGSVAGENAESSNGNPWSLAPVQGVKSGGNNGSDDKSGDATSNARLFDSRNIASTSNRRKSDGGTRNVTALGGAAKGDTSSPELLPLPIRRFDLRKPVESAGETSRRVPTIDLKVRTELVGTVEPIFSGIPDSAHPSGLSSNRNHAYENIIKYIQQAVRLQIELEVTKANVERWKRTQFSPQYARASPATRKILDDQRARYSQDVIETKGRLNSTIKGLSESPNFTERPKEFSPEVVKDQLMPYITQLKDWTKKLHLYNRVNSPSPLPKPLEDPRKRTWELIKASVIALENLADTITEDIYFKNFTNVLDVDTKIAPLLKAREAMQQNASMLAEERSAALLIEANQVGEGLGALAEPTANLVVKAHQEQQELERLRAKLVEREKIEAQIRLSFEQFEEWQREDAAQIQEMTERLKSLHTLPRPLTPPLSLDDLLPAIRTIVVDDLQDEIKVLTRHMRTACAEANEIFVREIYKKLQPIVDLTDTICSRAREYVESQRD